VAQYFGYDLKSADELRGTIHDVFALAKNNVSDKKQFPKIYMWCGDDDLILDHSVRFDKYLTELGVEHKYEQSAGDHSWGFWDLHIQDGLRFLLK
jgi:S-formylglutathione hydrolase FrmB